MTKAATGGLRTDRGTAGSKYVLVAGNLNAEGCNTDGRIEEKREKKKLQAKAL